MAGAFYLIVFLLLSIFILRLTIKNGIDFIFRNTITLGAIFFLIIHIALPVFQIEVGFFRYESSYDYFYFIISLLVSAVLCIAFFSAFNVNIPNVSSININNRLFKKYLAYSLIIFLIGIYFSISNLLSILSMGLDVYLSDRISFGYGSAYKMLLSDWIYVSSILFFIGFYISKSKSLSVLSLLLFVFSLFYTLFYYSITGNRNSVFVLLVILASLYYIFRNKNYKIKLIIKVVAVFSITSIFFILNYVGQARSSGFKNDNVELSSFKSIVESLNGAFGNNENIVWLISNNYEYQYGITYFAALTNIMPRFLWEGKPLGAGPRLKNFIYPGSYVVGDEGNSSLTTGLITEVLMNFNLIFSLLFLFIFGFFLKRIVRKLLFSNNLFYMVSGSILAVCISTLMLYSEFLGFFSRVVFMLIPLLIAANLFKIRVSR